MATDNSSHEHDLKAPWLIAAWPGMGGVGISAAYYLMAKLGMHLLSELPAREFFEIDNVEVKNGLIVTGRPPRNRLFLWKDPEEKHDFIVFLGEEQPPARGDSFCRQLVAYVRKLGVERVFTFAAMATQMRPEDPSRVFGAAIDRESLAELSRLDLEILEEGKISGLNGVLLGIAAESGMHGGCILGEMPHVFPQFPFPKASLAILKRFMELAEGTIDFSELEEQAGEVEKKLEEILERVEKSVEQSEPEAQYETPIKEEKEAAEQPRLTERDRQRIDELFKAARQDRSRAYELKKELDRLKVFEDYEDRFLDLFKEPQ
ncbi:MAG: PAC2 family protein [Opitutales bacterium]